jgi:hypothetical protein
MRGLAPGIHVFLSVEAKTWMAGTSPAMTSPLRNQLPYDSSGDQAGSEA